ncbi:hypothetical protein EC968_004829 [Mortierella alpina]|nr:hypothetical protein EC968_004829 [Mortierella alpina]
MDGLPPDQKAKVHAERTKARVKTLGQIDSLLEKQYQDRMQQSGLDLTLSRMPALELRGVAKYTQYTAIHRDAIHEFYHGSWYMKHSWEASKAQAASYDYAIKAVLGLVGGSEGRKHKESGGPAPVFALVWVHLIHKLDFFPNTQSLKSSSSASFLTPTKNRSRHCAQCKIYVDRDQGGSENIAHIALAKIKCQERPKKYKPANHL